MINDVNIMIALAAVVVFVVYWGVKSKGKPTVVINMVAKDKETLDRLESIQQKILNADNAEKVNDVIISFLTLFGAENSPLAHIVDSTLDNKPNTPYG